VTSANNRPAFRHFWDNPQFQPSPAWNSEARGGFFFGAPDTSRQLLRIFEVYNLPQARAKNLAFHDECCDFTELHFSEERVQELMHAAERLASVSDKVYFLYFPDRPSVVRPPETIARIAALLERLRAGSRIELLDLAKTGGFEDSDYFDVVHLNEAGVERLERLVAVELNRHFRDRD
jgi:hypothetical protein